MEITSKIVSTEQNLELALFTSENHLFIQYKQIAIINLNLKPKL